MSTKALGLTTMTASQYQKEVTFNESLYLIDAILGNGIISRLDIPPGSPVEGDTYIVKATATGDWLAKENNVAQFVNGAWKFYLPSEGWEVYIVAEENRIRYNGTAWGAIESLTIGPEADSFLQVLVIQRSGSAVGVIDNSGSNMRLKAQNGKDINIINDASDGIFVKDSGAIVQDLVTSQPADGDIGSNRMAMWLDTAGSKLKFRVNVGGTYKDGEVTLA